MGEYNIYKKDPVSVHVPKNITLEKFKIRPEIKVFRGKPGENNRSITILIIYRIICVFQDGVTPPRRFASTEQEFVITKDDDETLHYNGKIVYECLQITERNLEEVMRKHNTLQSFRSFGMKRITFESWEKGHQGSGNIPPNPKD